MIGKKTSGSRPIATSMDSGSTSRKMVLVHEDGSLEIIRGKGPNGVFVSAIYYQDGKYVFDADAQSLGVQNPGQYITGWKGKLGTGDKLLNGLTAEELETLYVAYQREVAEKQLGISLQNLPAYASRSHSVSDVGAAAMGRAMEKAGFKLGLFISEQSAVVYGYVKHHDLATRAKELTFFEFDQGGWSLDTCAGVAGGGRIDIKGTRSIPNVGGMEMSRRLKELVLVKAAKLLGIKEFDTTKLDADTLYQLKERIEIGKINLTEHQSIVVNVPSPDTGKVKSVPITQDEYHTAVLNPLLKPMRDCVEQTLADAKMAVKDIEFLIGSGAPMANRYMCDWLGKLFGRPMETDSDPALAVILGVAAYAFDDLTRQGKTKVLSVPEISLTDRLPALIAVMMQMGDSSELFAVPLFEKDTPVPSNTVIRARLVHKNQDSVDIKIAQAPCAYAKLAEVKIIGQGRITNLPREQVMTDRLEFRGKLRSGGLTDVLVVDTISQLNTFITAQFQN